MQISEVMGIIVRDSRFKVLRIAGMLKFISRLYHQNFSLGAGLLLVIVTFMKVMIWIRCIMFEKKILFQIPWRYLRVQNVTLLRYFVVALLVVMGAINVHSMWQLCMEVHNSMNLPKHDLMIYEWIFSYSCPGYI